MCSEYCELNCVREVGAVLGENRNSSLMAFRARDMFGGILCLGGGGRADIRRGMVAKRLGLVGMWSRLR